MSLAEAPVAAAGSRGGGTAPRMQLERPAGVARGVGGRWVLPESEFGPGLVGGKSANLAELRRKLPAG